VSEKKEAINCDGASTRRRQPRSRSHKGKGAVDPWKARISPFPADRPSLGWAAHLEKGEILPEGAEQGADIALAFERWSSGGAPPFSAAMDHLYLAGREAERKRDGSNPPFGGMDPLSTAFANLARKRGMAIGRKSGGALHPPTAASFQPRMALRPQPRAQRFLFRRSGFTRRREREYDGKCLRVPEHPTPKPPKLPSLHHPCNQWVIRYG
jgi:hypothetical protein